MGGFEIEPIEMVIGVGFVIVVVLLVYRILVLSAIIKAEEIYKESSVGTIQHFANVGKNLDGTDKHELGSAPKYSVATLINEHGDIEYWPATQRDRDRFAKRAHDNHNEFIEAGIA